MKERNEKVNFALISRLLALGGIGLIILSRGVGEPERKILAGIGLTLTVAFLVQIILFAIKPGLFKDKPTHPD